MKKFLICLLLFTSTIMLYAQNQVSVISYKQDLVTLRCVGYGKKAIKAAADAELSAVKTILYVGATNTPYKLPLIQEGEQQIEMKHKAFFEKFYQSGYKQFIESSIITTPFGRNALKKKCITMDICVRVRQLRNHLEQNNIIRRFGL